MKKIMLFCGLLIITSFSMTSSAQSSKELDSIIDLQKKIFFDYQETNYTLAGIADSLQLLSYNIRYAKKFFDTTLTVKCSADNKALYLFSRLTEGEQLISEITNHLLNVNNLITETYDLKLFKQRQKDINKIDSVILKKMGSNKNWKLTSEMLEWEGKIFDEIMMCNLLARYAIFWASELGEEFKSLKSTENEIEKIAVETVTKK
jgi:hypothetical protein